MGVLGCGGRISLRTGGCCVCWHPLHAQIDIVGAKILPVEVLLGQVGRYYVIVCDVGALVLVEQLHTLHIPVNLENLWFVERRVYRCFGEFLRS